MVNQNGKILNDLEIATKDNRTIPVTPKKEYHAGNYYLLIKNFEAKNGEILADDVKVEFSVE